MKNIVFFISLLLCLNTLGQSQPLPEKYQTLRLGDVKPMGWIKAQMRRDLAGFVGNLDRLVPDLIVKDDIYGKNRLTKAIKTKDLGALGMGENDVQILWWNSETQSNWRDGFVRQAFLAGDPKNQQQATAYIRRILATQDADGYLGVYAPDLRYKLTGENGELWAKATLFRVLLGYYELTNDAKTWRALRRAVDNVLVNYPINRSSPFRAEKPFAGLSHGLVFTDVLDRMHQLTGERKYLDYALFLYRDYSKNAVSETDVQLPNILNDSYLMHGHGVHSYEHLRPLTVAYWASGDDTLKRALNQYRQRISRLTTPSGGPIGDEWITQQTADATHTGYEYCSIHELVHSYAALLQKNGDAQLADEIERTFFNAAQGARHPDKSSIAYLKTDNSFAMTGSRNGADDPKQTRYKYSPTHQQAAVCCVPNAGRIAPYFVQAMWVKDQAGLVANLLGPCRVQTTLGKNRVRIDEQTDYPYQNSFVFKVEAQQPFVLKIRKPAWAENVVCSRACKAEGNYLTMKIKPGKTSIRLAFAASVRAEPTGARQHYFSYGPLVYARPLLAREMVSKTFGVPGFADLTYQPSDTTTYSYVSDYQPIYSKSEIQIKAQNNRTGAVGPIRLVPMGRTLLRQVTF